MTNEIKSRINPAYQDLPGTESFERKWLCDQIDRLTVELEWHQQQEGEALKAAQARRAEFENVVRERDELKGALLSAAMESTPTAQVERQRKTILELQDVLHDARSVLLAWAENHESQVTREIINKINSVLWSA